MSAFYTLTSLDEDILAPQDFGRVVKHKYKYLEMTEEEKEQRIQASRRESERLRAIEEEKRKGHVHCQLFVSMGGGIAGFDYNRIPQYLTHGVWLDGVHYFVAAPEITNPHYMSLNAASSYLFDYLGADTVHTFNKWDGEKMLIMRLTKDEESNQAIFLHRNVAMLVPMSPRACQLELLKGTPRCVAGSIPEIQSTPITTYAIAEQADGLIISTDIADYRVKTTRTYDLRVSQNKLLDKEGKTYGPCVQASEGQIVEVGPNFQFMKIRHDKTEPLTTTQIDQVTKSVVLGTLPVVRSNSAMVPYETIVSTAHRIAVRLLNGELFWTQEAVSAAMIVPAHFSKEEIYGSVQPHLGSPVTQIVKEVGELGIRRVGNVLYFREPALVKLTLIDYLEEAVKATSLTHLKRKLINDGKVFTPADFRVLREVFFRGYKHHFVLNVGYVAYCHPLSVMQVAEAAGKSDLPYIGKAVCGQVVDIPASKFFSPFVGYKSPTQPLLLVDLVELPKDVYYSDLLELATRTGKSYDAVSIGQALHLIGKQLIGSRPWRMPAIPALKQMLVEEHTPQGLSNRVGVPVPYLVQFIEQHLDVFEFMPTGKIRLRDRLS